MCSVKIEQRLLKRIGVREWGLPTLVMPGKIWRSENCGTVSCMLANGPNMVRTETLPIEVIRVGELSVMPLAWREAIWEYVQAWPSSGCGLGPFLAISEEERCSFVRMLGEKLVSADDIAALSIAHDIGQFASYEYETVEPVVQDAV